MHHPSTPLYKTIATSALDPQITFLATTYAPECRHRVDKRLDGYYTIQFMERGAVFLAYDEEEYSLTGAWFWPAHPGPRIRFHADPKTGSWFHRHVGFQGPLVAQWIAAGLWPNGPQPMPEGRDYPALFDAIIEQAGRTDRWGTARAANLVEQLLLELAESRAQPPRSDSWLHEVIERLGGEGWVPDYAGLADALGMGLSTLRRRFRTATGMPLHRFVLQRRMATARALLAETDLPIKEVAERLGYENVYFFSRQFRQLARVPPGVYRHSRQG